MGRGGSEARDGIARVFARLTCAEEAPGSWGNTLLTMSAFWRSGLGETEKSARFRQGAVRDSRNGLDQGNSGAGSPDPPSLRTAGRSESAAPLLCCSLEAATVAFCASLPCHLRRPPLNGNPMSLMWHVGHLFTVAPSATTPSRQALQTARAWPRSEYQSW